MLLLLTASAPAAEFPKEEVLHYNVNWPSGLSLGEGRMSAKRVSGSDNNGDAWGFELRLEAAIPGFAVLDRFESLATDNYCSITLTKDSTHGKRRAEEKTVFDPQAGVAVRTTVNGGKSEIPISACGRDALAYLYYVRSELLNGRIPPAQAIQFGASYRIRMEHGGTRKLQIAGEAVEVDRMITSVKGPASQVSFEIYFARDAVRTPVLVKVPLPLGSFSMELAP